MTDGGRGGLVQSALLFLREEANERAGEDGLDEYGGLSDTNDAVGGGMRGAFSRTEDMRDGECGTSCGSIKGSEASLSSILPTQIVVSRRTPLEEQ